MGVNMRSAVPFGTRLLFMIGEASFQAVCLADVDGRPVAGRSFFGEDVIPRRVFEFCIDRVNPVLVLLAGFSGPQDGLCFGHSYAPLVSESSNAGVTGAEPQAERPR